MSRLIGCAGLLAIIGFLSIEVWFFIVMSGWVNRALYNEAGHDVVSCFILLIIMTVVGWRFAAWHIRQIPAAFMAGKAGRHLIGALGGALLVIPGFLSDIVGVILLLPPIQIALSAVGNRLVKVFAAQVMRRMMGGMGANMGGGMGGGAGAFPGGFPGAFPGFPGASGGLKPDEALRFPGMRPTGPRSIGSQPKTYDTTAEK